MSEFCLKLKKSRDNCRAMLKLKTVGLGVLLFLVAGCASKEVDLSSSPYTQAATIKDMGGSYKIGNPYQIMGQWYYPKEDYDYVEEGVASWYGEDFHAKTTANGEAYNMNTLTAAHRTLPLPSIVRVTNMENGRSLVLRVNDRGPYVKNRIIDVSKRAAELLGFKTKGTAKVRVEILPKESLALKQALTEPNLKAGYSLANARDESFDSSVPPPVSMNPNYNEYDRNYIVGASLNAQPIQEYSNVNISNQKPVQVAQAENKSQVNHYVAAGGKKFYVQAGAFSKQEAAQNLSRQLRKVGEVLMTTVEVDGKTFYRVRLGPYNAQSDAAETAEKLYNYGINDARIVKD